MTKAIRKAASEAITKRLKLGRSICNDDRRATGDRRYVVASHRSGPSFLLRAAPGLGLLRRLCAYWHGAKGAPIPYAH
jgi:hypothetical protein